MSYSKHEVGNKTTNNTEYFRPSQLPILNDREFKSGFFGEFYMKEPNEIILPSYLLESPEDSIINFFSILRQAANYVEGKGTGCGTLGYARLPYPVAYNFLSQHGFNCIRIFMFYGSRNNISCFSNKSHKKKIIS
ncbi:MAG: hypothetical protein N4A63_13060 [Vallitalea sp.]|jgi:hypothetical protein|nr:hypothetical protein [Vallitalea sp.]